MRKVLYRSQTDILISGVCGGLAEYLGIGSLYVRLFFVLLAFAGTGIGVLIYLLLWIVLPPEDQVDRSTLEENVRQGSAEIADQARRMAGDLQNMVGRPDRQLGLILGLGLLLAGVYSLLVALDLPWLSWLDFDLIWPLLVLIAGVVLLWRVLRGE